MKKKLFNILPTWLKQLKYADKIAHAIYGTLFYILLALFLPREFAFFLTFIVGVLVEIADKQKGGESDFYDLIATIIVPIVLYIFFNLRLFILWQENS